MNSESNFLRGLLGKPVEIIAVDEDDLPPMVLREVSGLGVVAEGLGKPRFFPWNEIVEISPCDLDEVAHEEAAYLCVDSEP